MSRLAIVLYSAFLPCFALAMALLVGVQSFAPHEAYGQAPAKEPAKVPAPVKGTAKVPAKSAYPEVEDALLVFRRGNLDGAYRLLAAAREKHIELPLAEVMLARFCFAHNKGEEGKQLLERAVANHPEDPEAYLMLGEIATAGGNLAEADGLYGLALEKIEPLAADNPRRSPLLVAAHSGSALVDERRQLWPKAEEHLHKWISLQPRSQQAISRLARTLFAQQKYDETREQFTLLKQIDSNQPVADIQMGLLYEQAGERKLATTAMNAALATNGGELETRLAVANWALYAGEIETAKTNVAAAIKLQPDNTAAQLLQGILYRFGNEPEKAEEVFRAVHEKSPTNFDATNHLALSLTAQEDEAKRQQGVEYAKLNIGAHRDLRNNLGRTAQATLAWALFRAGNTAAARQAIEPLLKAGRFPPQAGYYAAEIYQSVGANDLAAKLLAAAIKSPRAFPEKEAARKLQASMAPNKPSAP